MAQNNNKSMNQTHPFYGTDTSGEGKDFLEVREFDPEEILPNPDQPRKTFDDEFTRELAESIRQYGQLSPGVVRKAEQGYYIVIGETRYRACKLIGRPFKAFLLKSGDKAGHAMELSLTENLQRQDLDPLDTAEYLAKLMEVRGYDQEQLADVLGKSRVTVTEFLGLNNLPDYIKAESRDPNVRGRTSKTMLLHLMRITDPEQQRAEWEKVKTGKTSAAKLREKKATGAIDVPRPAAARLISAGRSFVNKLRDTAPEEIIGNRDQLKELLKLHREITDLIKALPKDGRARGSRSTDMPEADGAGAEAVEQSA